MQVDLFDEDDQRQMDWLLKTLDTPIRKNPKIKLTQPQKVDFVLTADGRPIKELIADIVSTARENEEIWVRLDTMLEDSVK